MRKEKSLRVLEAWRNSKSEYHTEIVENLLNLQERLRARANRAAEAQAPPPPPPAPAPAPPPAQAKQPKPAEAKQKGKAQGEPRPEPRPELKPEPKPELKPELKPEPKPEPKPELKPELKPEPPTAPAVVATAPAPETVRVVERDVQVIQSPGPSPDPALAERVRHLEEGAADLADSVTAVYAEVGEQIVSLRQDVWSEMEDLRANQDQVEARIMEVLMAHRDQIRRILDEHFSAMRKAVQAAKEEASS